MVAPRKRSDDYLTKPFGVRRAVGARRRDSEAMGQPAHTDASPRDLTRLRRIGMHNAARRASAATGGVDEAGVRHPVSAGVRRGLCFSRTALLAKCGAATPTVTERTVDNVVIRRSSSPPGASLKFVDAESRCSRPCNPCRCRLVPRFYWRIGISFVVFVLAVLSPRA